ncbi:MAG: MFS transporter, partial [Candidatus Dormibacteraceae bacterium]
RYAWGDPELRMPLLMMAAIAPLAMNFSVLFPIVATRIFHGGAGLYGGLYAAMGVGAFCAALFLAYRARSTMLLVIGAAFVFGVGLLLAAEIRILPLELLVLVPTGAGMALFQAGTNSNLQLRSKPEFRGRVLSIYVLAFTGTAPIGGLLIGWVAQQFGADVGLGVGGISAIATAVLTLLWLRGYHRRLKKPEPRTEAL